MGSFMIIVLLILLLFVFEYPKIFIPIILVAVGISFVKVKKVNNEILEKQKAIAENEEVAWKKYNQIRSRVAIPAETHIVCYKNGDANILKGNLQVWIDDNMLCFFPFIPCLDEDIKIDEKVNLFQISIDNINYYIMIDRGNKEIILNYYFEGKECSMIFTNKDYIVFKELLQGKSYSSVRNVFNDENKD